MDGLPDPRPMLAKDALKWEIEKRAGTNGTQAILRRDNVLESAETTCHICKRRLVYNGYNQRVVILDHGLGKRRYRVHRKRCPACGDVPLDLTFLAPRYGRYSENYVRRARQHHMNGLYPSRIAAAMRVDFKMRFPRTTIVSWNKKMRKPLRKFHETTLLSISNYTNHDETFLLIRGRNAYAQVTIDSYTGLALAVTITERNDRSSATRHLNSIRRYHGMQIKSLVMDGTAKLGTLLTTRLFKQITRGQCVLHLKWLVTRKLKQLAGIHENSFTRLPEKYHGLRAMFYDVFDSHDETGAFIALERLRPAVQSVNKRVLSVLFASIESKLPQIIAWQRDPFIERTNNKCENFHQRLQYYPTFKRRMMSLAGAQFVADSRVFFHNIRQIPLYFEKLQQRKEQYKAWSRETPRDPSLAGCPPYFHYEGKRVMTMFEKYEAFWEHYLEY